MHRRKVSSGRRILQWMPKARFGFRVPGNANPERGQGLPDRGRYVAHVPRPEASSLTCYRSPVQPHFVRQRFVKPPFLWWIDIEISPEPWINAHSLNWRNAAAGTEPPERTIIIRPCGGEICNVRTNRALMAALVEGMLRRNFAAVTSTHERANRSDSGSQRNPDLQQRFSCYADFFDHG